MRRGVRVVEGARLESVCAPKGYRGFESHPLRHVLTKSNAIKHLTSGRVATPRSVFCLRRGRGSAGILHPSRECWSESSLGSSCFFRYRRKSHRVAQVWVRVDPMVSSGSSHAQGQRSALLPDFLDEACFRGPQGYRLCRTRGAYSRSSRRKESAAAS